MALRTVGVRLMADTTGFITRIKAAEQSVQSFHKELGDKAASSKLDNLADKAGVMGLGLAAGFGYAVKAAMDFDKQMSAVSAGTGATAGEMKQLKQAALDAGKATQFSATQAAEGITELGKAGVDTKDILGGGLKGALDLAAAGQLGVGEAAETAASAMVQFKLSGKDVPHIADLLAAGAGKAQGSVHDMGAALNQAGLVAAQTGLSIEETTGGLAAFANAGLTGSDAGTSFKQMLLMLQAPADKTQKLMDEMGISLYDNQGQFIGLAKFADQLRGALKDLTPEQRQSTLATIFGADATRAASIIYENGGKGIQTWIDKVNDSGYAQETASKLTDNLAGDVERLKGSFETMAIEAGGGANGGLRILVQAMNKLLDVFGALPPGISATLTVMAGVGGVLLLAMAGWVKLRKAIAETADELRKVGPAGETAANGLEKGSKMAGKAAIAFAGLEAISMGIKALTDNAPNIDALTASLEEMANTGKATGELKNIFGENMKDFGRVSFYANEANHGFGKFFNTVQTGLPIVGDLSDALSEGLFGTSFNDATQKYRSLDTALTQAMETTKDANKASELWNQLSRESGLEADQLAKLLPSAYAQVGKMNTEAMKAKDGLGKMSDATKEAAEQTNKYKTTADAAAGALKGEHDAFKLLANAMRTETDPVFGLIDAQNRLNKSQTEGAVAQKEYEKAVKKYGKSSQEAKAAQDKVNSAVRDGAAAAVDLEEKVGSLGGTFNGKLSPELLNTFRAAGLTDKQIKNLTGQFQNAKKSADKFAGTYEAKSSAPGANKARDELEKAWASALGFDGDYKAKSSAPGAKSAGAEIQDAWNKANGFDGNYKANLSAPGAPNATKAAADAWAQAKGFEGKYDARLTVSGMTTVNAALADLMIKQRALATGLSYTSARSAVQKDLDRNRVGKYATGGWTGPGAAHDEAGIVHADEFVIKKSSRQRIEARAPGLLDRMNQTGDIGIPGYASGGHVVKLTTTAAKTKIPSLAEVLAVVAPPTPPAGQTYKWIMQMVAQAFPGLKAISTVRPGARTLTGNRSLHADGDAVDYPASQALAQFWNKRFGGITTELITPWNNLNLWHGKPHKYTGAVWNQHNFAGGNAHDHIGVRPGTATAAAGAAATGALLGWIMRALQLTGTSSTWIGPLTTLIKRESGGNPRAINNWDSNAKKGQASRGLMQTIPSTFAAYRLKSLPNNIYDPVANIAAGIRYIKSRYGTIFNVQQANSKLPPKGYANGGLISEPIVGVGKSGRTYTFGEHGPERVTPGMGNWASSSGGGPGGGVTYVNLNVSTSVGTHPREVGRQVVDSIGAYLQGGGELRVNGSRVF